ncbi:MAG: chemotaxis-specific protein-glutamate methyltransferase CheB [Lachnospiraceae bacterium]|nr:chemotaxis-specific protein-glutamate methyltransferase CheB [Lachnospiraceae bacterium]
MAKILIVDYSAIMRRWLCDIINADNDSHQIEVCSDGESAYNKITNDKYDLVLLDLAIPGNDGVELLAKLKTDKITVKVIAMSRTLIEDEMQVINAMQNGAYACIAKPTRISKSDTEFASNLMVKVHAALGGVKQITGSASDRISQSAKKTKEIIAGMNKTSNKEATSTSNIDEQTSGDNDHGIVHVRPNNRDKLIALACSTGGPQALHNMIPMIPNRMDVPLVLVQHMPEGFTAALADRLDRSSQVKVKEAAQGDVLKPGVVYIAPGGRHLELCENRNGDVTVNILDTPPVNSLKPCADVMYDSIQKLHYKEIICVVLTGMGADGTRGIKDLKQHKKTYVISESQETCVVYGMPKSVEQAGLSDEVVPIKKIADAIMRRLGD